MGDEIATVSIAARERVAKESAVKGNESTSWLDCVKQAVANLLQCISAALTRMGTGNAGAPAMLAGQRLSELLRSVAGQAGALAKKSSVQESAAALAAVCEEGLAHVNQLVSYQAFHLTLAAAKLSAQSFLGQQSGSAAPAPPNAAAMTQVGRAELFGGAARVGGVSAWGGGHSH